MLAQLLDGHVEGLAEVTMNAALVIASLTYKEKVPQPRSPSLSQC